jgi:hypothetical protein
VPSPCTDPPGRQGAPASLPNASCPSTAACTAASASSNNAINPSPWDFITTPECKVNEHSGAHCGHSVQVSQGRTQVAPILSYGGRPGWLLALGAALLCVAVSVAIATLPSNDLDLDALLPGLNEAVNGSRQGGPQLIEEARDEWRSVQAILVALCSVAVLPVIVPQRLYRFVLLASAAVLTLFVIVTILRLGIVYAPVVLLQVGALSCCALSAGARSPAECA